MKSIFIHKHNLMRAAMTLALIVTCATAWAQDFIINSAADWDTFRTNIANGETYNGKTVSLNADISVGLMVCDDDHSFQGTFEGNGHTLTISQSGNVDFIAPFSHVRGNAVFRNLTVAGYINSNTKSYAAGLIGHLFGSVTIENCTSALSITSTGGAGGFVGLCEHTVTFINCKSSAVITSAGGNNGGFVGWSRSSGYDISFTGCIFNGKLLQANGTGSGAGFIGWKGDSKTVTITNCLYDPASLSSGQSYASSSIFCNQHSDYPATITNSYYITATGTAQGKQARSITAGENVTVAHAGNATVYNVSGITAYKNGNTQLLGLLYNNVLYAGNQEQVSLNIGCTVNPPSGFQYNYNASAGTLSGNSNPYTLTMPDANVTITASLGSTHQPISVSYIAADGTTKTANAIALDGTETDLGSSSEDKWYVVNSDISHTGQIYCTRNVNLILADDKTMTVNNGSGTAISGSGNLTIYGQTNGTGTLDASCNFYNPGSNAIFSNQINIYGGIVKATASSGCGGAISANTNITISGGQVTAIASGTSSQIAISAGNNVTISGGQVTATATTSGSYGIKAKYVNISGGQITANGGNYGIMATYSVTLDWSNTTDVIYANSYNSYYSTISIANGKYFKDANSGNVYCGNVGTSINGKTLIPATQADYVAYVFAQNVSGSGTAQSPYLISTEAGWNAFCNMIEIGETFSGKIVKLNASISVSRMAGIYSTTNNNGHAFSGTFNGQNNTLTFNCTAASSNYVAPFGYVKGGNCANGAINISNLNVVTNITAEDYRHMGGLIALQVGHVNVTDCNANVTLSATKGTNNSTDLYPAGLVSQVSSSDNGTLTLSGCTVTGTIATDGKYAAGMVGVVQGSATITNSKSSVTINSSTAGDGTHGGLVAVSYPGSTTIEGCLFNGKLLTANTGETTATTNCGGFVGWRTTGTVTISNSLYAPANIANNETEVGVSVDDSYTFSRNWTGTPTNCYFTRALGTEQGKQQRSITAGSNVTIEAIALTGTTTNYNVSGITAYSNGGLSLGNTLYYGNQDPVSLTLSHSDLPSYTFTGYTTTGGILVENGNAYTLTMPNADVTIGAEFELQTVSVNYLDENGDVQTVNAVPLTGGGATTLAAGWYVVNSDISYTGTVTLGGNVNLILADGYTMNVGTSENRLDNVGIRTYDNYQTLTIYGQSTGDHMGILSVYTSCHCISLVALTINGGHVIANTNGGYAYYALYTTYQDITINGGTVEATASGNDSCHAISSGYDFTYAGGTLTTATTSGNAIYARHKCYTFTWRNPSDQIVIASTGLFAPDDTYTATFTKAFTDGTNIYSGTLTGTEAISALAGKTLYPAVAVTLNDGITAGNGIYSSGENLYAQVGQTVTVNANSVTVPTGYTFSGITVTPSVAGTNNGNGTYSFTVPAEDVTVSATFAQIPVTYLDANGQQQYCTNYTVLTGGGATTLTAGWYVVNSDISYTGTITLDGDVNLILADDCTMNVGTSSERIDCNGIRRNGSQALTIYGQNAGSGVLSVYTTGDFHLAIAACALTINGGHVTANTDGTVAWAIYADETVTVNSGNVTAHTDRYNAIFAGEGFFYNGGIVSAIADDTTIGTHGYVSPAIASYDSYNFSWRNPSDQITIGSTGLYVDPDDADAFTATFTKAFTDGTNIYSGTLTGNQLNAIASKTFYPAVAVTLNDGITAGSGFINSGDNLYAQVGQTVTIGVTAPEGYAVSGIIVTPATGDVPAVTDNGNGIYSFTMPAADVTVSATFELQTVTYLDENGMQQQCTNYIILSGEAINETLLSTGWYVVEGTIYFGNIINIEGDVHLILKDNAVMNAGSSGSPIEADWGIYDDGHSLSIYAQSTGENKGQLNAYASGIAMLSLNGSVTINGGQVTAHGNYYGIFATNGSVTINGGQVSANGDINGGIGANSSTITLGWTSPNDFIYANSYQLQGTSSITVKDGKTFVTDDATPVVVSGPISDLSLIDGKTLRPYNEWIGNGSEENPYMIFNKDQLNLLAQRVNSGNDYYASYFKLGADITYPHTTAWNDATSTENNYEAIGNSYSPFKGHIDGDGHTISGIRIYKGDNDYQGLFGKVSGADIHDVTLADARITGGANTGGIVGYNSGIEGDNFGTVTRCHVASNVAIHADHDWAERHGGIVGENEYYCTISHCTSAATLTIDANATECKFYGAIAGHSWYEHCTIEDNLAIGATLPAVPSNFQGAICGINDGALARNYYYNCTVAGVQNATGVGCGNLETISDITDNDGAVYAVIRMVEGYGESTASDHWTFISSPLMDDNTSAMDVVNLINTTTPANYDLYKLVNTTWANYKTYDGNIASGFSLENGQGYLYANKNDVGLVFKGTYNTDNSKNVTLQQGWNLVGNPLTDSAYINTPFYKMNAAGTGIEAVSEYWNNKIAVCTGVVVNAANAGDVAFSKTVPAHSTGNNGHIQMTLAQTVTTRGGSSTATLDNAIVSFNEGSQLGKFYFGTQKANLYIPQNGKDYAIVCGNNHNEIPVNFKAKENSEYKISVNPEGVEMVYLHLIDNMTGADVDLLASPEYTFNAKVTDYESRFKLVFVSNTAFEGESDNETFAFYSNGSWIIANEGKATLQVIDLNGRILSSETVNGSVSKSINQPAGVYVLRLINGKETKVQKMVIK